MMKEIISKNNIEQNIMLKDVDTKVKEDIDNTIEEILKYNTIVIPKTHKLFQPLLTVVPAQMIAYETAKLKGEEIDTPRNLAKSVTVE